jgi:hypothetical protein
MLRSLRCFKPSPRRVESVLAVANNSSGRGIVGTLSGQNTTLTLLRAPSHDFEVINRLHTLASAPRKPVSTNLIEYNQCTSHRSMCLIAVAQLMP